MCVRSFEARGLGYENGRYGGGSFVCFDPDMPFIRYEYERAYQQGIADRKSEMRQNALSELSKPHVFIPEPTPIFFHEPKPKIDPFFFPEHKPSVISELRFSGITIPKFSKEEEKVIDFAASLLAHREEKRRKFIP